MNLTKADIEKDYPALHAHMLLLARAAQIEDCGFTNVDQTVRAKYESEWRTAFADIFKPGMFKPLYGGSGAGAVSSFELRINPVLSHAIMANSPLYLQQAVVLAKRLQAWDADSAITNIADLYRPDETYVLTRLNEATTTALARVLYGYALQGTGLYENLDMYFDQYIMTMTSTTYPNYNAQRYAMRNGRPKHRMVELRHTPRRHQPRPLVNGSMTTFENVYTAGEVSVKSPLIFNLPNHFRRTLALDRLVEKLVAKWDEKVYGVQIED